MYDIAIIGLGPAGATLAQLLDSRLRVIALDKKQADSRAGFHKPCGGLLAPTAQKALSRLGLALPLNILEDPQLFSEVLNNKAQDPHAAYHVKTLKMQGQLFSKNLKSLFIYNSALRGAIMRSGLGSFSFIK